jgi:hypothetical protein
LEKGRRPLASGLLHSPLYDIDVLADGHDFDDREISDKHNGYHGEEECALSIIKKRL